jgi:hypothetical protein
MALNNPCIHSRTSTILCYGWLLLSRVCSNAEAASIPSRETLMDNELARLYAAALCSRDRALASEDYFKLMLDGWSDLSNNSIYGVMLLHDHTNSDVLDMLNFSSNQHTAVNVLTEVEDCVNQSYVKSSAIKCCVTDSHTT